MRQIIEDARSILVYVRNCETSRCEYDARAIIGDESRLERRRGELFDALMLLFDGGYLEGNKTCMRLTFEGEEFAANVCSDEIWDSIRRKVDRIGGDIALRELVFLSKYVVLTILGVF